MVEVAVVPNVKKKKDRGHKSERQLLRIAQKGYSPPSQRGDYGLTTFSCRFSELPRPTDSLP
jgi:hypothetical protein